MKTSDFDYSLPSELIAQQPLPKRDSSRLLLLDRRGQTLEHHRFGELPQLLRAGDLLVLNDTKVMSSRLWAWKKDTGARIELLLLEELAPNHWQALARPGKKLKPGSELRFERGSFEARVRGKREDGTVELEFSGAPNLRQALAEIAEAPLPPYIQRKPNQQNALDKERYQTIFARKEGAVAAPTAGLHFSEEILAALQEHGIDRCFVTLNVGLGTFQPVKTENVEDHRMHEERFEISRNTTNQINQAKEQGRRVVAVGTTSLRVLETVALPRTLSSGETGCSSAVTPHEGATRLFIYPPYQFKIVDGLLTNFHLPRSTLLMLVCALAGRDFVLRAYAEAIRAKYRFYSYGDCMLVV